MNVGQGDGAVLISPAGQTVLFDSGVRNNCDLPLAYLQQLGLDEVHYHIASHYHDDHIGCADTVLAAFPVRRAAIDRGESYTTGVYGRYVSRVGALRRAATPGMTITLDSGTAHPVVITIRVVNGATTTGDTAATNNENDRSVLAWVRFGLFDALIGGDLSGARTSSYRDVETPAAAGMSQVELYKVHHHGSAHSSNAAWLAAIAPRIGIISAGPGNTHGHPTTEAMARLHAANVRTYWTTAGAGDAQPVAGRDVVGGNIIVEVTPGSPAFTVTYGGTQVDTYRMWEAPADAATVAAYAWSVHSDVYHYANCSYVRSISPANLAQGGAPPAGKRLHTQCPRQPGGNP
jgi:beta-lactamase superfamily II metal-dependent hydrolase